MMNQRFRFLWQEPEYSTVDNNLVFHLKDDASEIAKKSYKEYQRYYSKEMEEKPPTTRKFPRGRRKRTFSGGIHGVAGYELKERRTF